MAEIATLAVPIHPLRTIPAATYLTLQWTAGTSSLRREPLAGSTWRRKAVTTSSSPLAAWAGDCAAPKCDIPVGTLRGVEQRAGWKRSGGIMTAYLARLRKQHDRDYGVDFPAFPGCMSAGKTLEVPGAWPPRRCSFIARA
jgi:hypothetical protein